MLPPRFVYGFSVGLVFGIVPLVIWYGSSHWSCGCEQGESMHGAPLDAMDLYTGDDEEMLMRLSDLPQSVQNTLITEASGGNVEEIEKTRKNGKVIYEAEVVIDGMEYEIEIASDGRLLSREIEYDDDDDDDEEEDYDEDDDEDEDFDEDDDEDEDFDDDFDDDDDDDEDEDDLFLDEEDEDSFLDEDEDLLDDDDESLLEDDKEDFLDDEDFLDEEDDLFDEEDEDLE